MKCWWKDVGQESGLHEALERARVKHEREKAERVARRHQKGEFWARKHAFVGGEWTCFYTHPMKAWQRAAWAQQARKHEMEVCSICGRPLAGTEGQKDWAVEEDGEDLTSE